MHLHPKSSESEKKSQSLFTLSKQRHPSSSTPGFIVSLSSLQSLFGTEQNNGHLAHPFVNVGLAEYPSASSSHELPG